jgi:hypothetical protein
MRISDAVTMRAVLGFGPVVSRSKVARGHCVHGRDPAGASLVMITTVPGLAPDSRVTYLRSDQGLGPERP